MMSTRSKVLLWAGLTLAVLVVVGVRIAPKETPMLLDLVGSDTRQFLTAPLFRLGKLSVTIAFLIKSFLFLLVLNIVSSRVRKLLYSHLLSRTAMGAERRYALARFGSIAVFALGLLVGLESAGVDLNTLAILGGTLGIGVGFGLQSIVANWVAGLVLLIEQPVRIGDCIDVGNTSGVILKIGGRSTWVRTYDNQVVIIPNSDLTGHQVTNWTADDPRVRLSIPVGVGYNSDPKQVQQLLMEIMSKNSEILGDPAPEAIFKGLGDNSLDFLLRFWTVVHPDHDHYGMKSNLYCSILETFRRQGIEIPFPQRDLHLRSADVPIVVASKTAPPSTTVP
jgi:small-conductance mechanosensitive channel